MFGWGLGWDRELYFDEDANYMHNLRGHSHVLGAAKAKKI
jgi:hypothetical protein